MTRINVIPTEELTDKHLVAEYRELPRALRRAVMAINKGLTPDDIKIAPAYKLGEGHELFFVDKCEWLWVRWCILRDEMIGRGMKPSDEFRAIIRARARFVRRHGKSFYNRYQVTNEAMVLNRERIKERLAA